MKNTLLVLVSLLGVTSAHAVQYIDCRPATFESNEHVIVSLKNESEGTLFYTEGLDGDGMSVNTGILPLKAISSTESGAIFEAKTADFTWTFGMPAEQVMKPSGTDLFNSSLSAEASESGQSSSLPLLCFSRIYTDTVEK